LAPRRVEFRRLLPEESIDVGVASVDVSAARGDEGLEPRGRVAEGSGGALDEAPVLLLRISLEERRPFEGGELHPDAGGGEVVGRGLADAGERGVAEVIARVEAVRVTGFGEQLFGLCRIVRVGGRLPVELKDSREDAPRDSGEPRLLLRVLEPEAGPRPDPPS
jgi:hypothetical protein